MKALKIKLDLKISHSKKFLPLKRAKLIQSFKGGLQLKKKLK